MTKQNKQFSELIKARLKNRETSIKEIQNPLDSVPEQVRQIREIEACQGRAVIQELKDLLEIINAIDGKN
jgi:septation ring formation regulator EzrA